MKPSYSNLIVKITDEDHPHFGEVGKLTTKTIRLPNGQIMAEVQLNDCPHGESACFVSPGQVEQLS
jgi:hypothetical protein